MKEWVLPFCPCTTATGLINSRALNPNSSVTAGEPASPTDLCKTGHFIVLTTGLELQACCPQQTGQGICANGIYFHLISEPHKCHLQEQAVMQKEREARVLNQVVLQNEF